MTDREIFEEFAARWTKAIKERTPKATGSTADAIGYSVTDTGLQITAPLHFLALVYGRGPTKSSGASSPTLRQMIEQWIIAKRITPRPGKSGKTPSLKSLAFLIARAIHRNGYRGRPGIIADWVTEDNIHELAKRIGQNRRQRVLSDILKSFNNERVSSQQTITV